MGQRWRSQGPFRSPQGKVLPSEEPCDQPTAQPPALPALLALLVQVMMERRTRQTWVGRGG